MRVTDFVNCDQFPCGDVRHESYRVPRIEVSPGEISIIMISEAAAADPGDDYYAEGEPLFLRTSLLAFQDAGVQVGSVNDLLARGIYLTTAVKCAKTGYGIERNTVAACSQLLEKELALFPNVKAYLLMGDVAIQALNAVARRAGAGRVIPAGPTYKIRGGDFAFRGARVYPSYLQAGPSFFIEKSKRRMIAKDIAHALEYARDRTN